MSRVIAIIKTAKDTPPWKGLPPDYPVSCAEYDSAEEAEAKHPGCLIMRVDDYHEYAKRFHDANPSPKVLAHRREAMLTEARHRSFPYYLWLILKSFFRRL
jgi:hypothetical protein